MRTSELLRKKHLICIENIPWVAWRPHSCTSTSGVNWTLFTANSFPLLLFIFSHLESLWPASNLIIIIFGHLQNAFTLSILGSGLTPISRVHRHVRLYGFQRKRTMGQRSDRVQIMNFYEAFGRNLKTSDGYPSGGHCSLNYQKKEETYYVTEVLGILSVL